jgi:hypothetical protein
MLPPAGFDDPNAHVLASGETIRVVRTEPDVIRTGQVIFLEASVWALLAREIDKA